MLAEQYLRMKADMEAHGIVFAYYGYLSERLLMALGEAIRQKMEAEEADRNVAKRVFSVFVEQVQNIIRYSVERLEAGAPPSPELGAGLVLVGHEAEHFFVACGNMIGVDQMPRLKARLDELAGMDKQAIKAYYREKLRDAPDDDSKGATLGLIEIARRASAPVVYDFRPGPRDEVFFCLKAYI